MRSLPLLLVISILCRSTGATLLLAVGFPRSGHFPADQNEMGDVGPAVHRPSFFYCPHHEPLVGPVRRRTSPDAISATIVPTRSISDSKTTTC